MKKRFVGVSPISWVESGVFVTMSVTLGVFAFFASGDATERFYVFLYPQKCGEFF